MPTVRNSIHFMEIKGSLPSSKEPTTGPYPVQDEASTHPHTLLLLDQF